MIFFLKPLRLHNIISNRSVTNRKGIFVYEQKTFSIDRRSFINRLFINVRYYEVSFSNLVDTDSRWYSFCTFTLTSQNGKYIPIVYLGKMTNGGVGPGNVQLPSEWIMNFILAETRIFPGQPHGQYDDSFL